MKKSLLMALLTMGLFACSEKDIVEPAAGGGVAGESEHNFLSVSIVPSQATGTRASGYDPSGDKGEYRDGSAFENEVKSIRFYFFDKDGEPAPVKANGASYYDVQKEEILQSRNEGDDLDFPGPVESTISAIIVIESTKGDKKPAYMAAVLNHEGQAPTQDVTVDKLQNWVRDYSLTKQNESFTMSSSVYKGTRTTYDYADPKHEEVGDDLLANGEENNIEFVAEPVYENIKSSREEALRNKATIYVERVLAKVSVGVDIDQTQIKDPKVEGGLLYYVGYVGDQGKALSEDWTPDADDMIYVRFLGWNVTADRKESRLVKKINTEWNNNFGGDWSFSWNNGDNFRSHWAINPETKSKSDKDTPIDDNYNFSPFATEDGSGWKKDPNKKNAWSYDFADNNFTYLQENAGKYALGTDSDVINSKIIVAAQLVDNLGNPLELVEWQGEVYRFGKEYHYDKTETLTDYEYVLKSMASDTYLFIEDASITDGTKPGWRKIDQRDVYIEFDQIKPADPAYDKNKEGEKRYYVTLKLKEPDANYGVWKFYPATDDADAKWDLDDNGGAGYKLNDGTNVVENAIKSIGKIKHWNTGYAYYWVNIRHFGDKEDGTGYYGVVRNHWYEYTFTGVKGLGVPVDNPGEIIYPEEPGEPDYFYLATEVKILSWRIVHGDNTVLGW